MAAARGNAAAMQYRAARNDQTAWSRQDDELSVFVIIVIDGLAAPIDIPLEIGIVKRGNVVLMSSTIAVGVIAVAEHAAIDIGALV